MNKFIAAILILFFCTTLNASPALKVGVSVPLSGPLALVGEAVKDGILSAQRDLGENSNLEFIFEDNLYSGNGGVACLRSLRDVKKVKMLVTFGGPAMTAMAPIIEAEKIPTIALSASSKLISGAGSPILRFWESAKFLGENCGSLVSKLNAKRVAIISWENEVFIEVRDAIKKVIPDEKIVFDEIISPQERDFSILIPKLRLAKTDLLIVNLAAGQAKSLLRRIKEQQIDSQLVFHSGMLFDSEVREPYPPNLEGSYLVTVDDRNAFELYAKLKQEKKEASMFYVTAIAYDVVKLLNQASRNGWNGVTLPIPFADPTGVLGKYFNTEIQTYEPPMRIARFYSGKLLPVVLD